MKKTYMYMLFSAAIAILIILSVVNYNQVNRIDQQLHTLNNMQYDIQDMSTSVHTVSSQVDMKMDEFLQEQLWIMKKEYKILNVDIETNTIDVLFEWGVRELLEQEQLSFMYREVDSKDWTELDVTNRNGLNYSLEYTLPLRGNYETQILATSTAGKRSETLLKLEFKQVLDTRIMTDAYLHYSGNGHVDFNVNIHNYIEGEFNLAGTKDTFKIKTAKAFLYVNGTVNREFDLLAVSQDFHSDGYSEYLNYHNYVDLEGEVQDVNDVELRVIVEDGLGLTYETIADAMQ